MNANTHTIIPDSENHCVWMDAGLVDYKLCNCRFECDACPFDKVMREQHHTFAERAALQSVPPSRDTGNTDVELPTDDNYFNRFLSSFSSLLFPEDRIYFSNHTWMKVLRDGIFQVGIDGFLAQLIYPVSGVATIRTASHIERDEPFAWIIRDSATLALHNNERGIALSINTQLMDTPSLITRDPYGEGWLMTITCPQRSQPHLKFLSIVEYKKFIQQETLYLMNEMQKNRNSIGTTMFDGGTRVENIEKLIGEKRYNKILLRLMSPH